MVKVATPPLRVPEPIVVLPFTKFAVPFVATPVDAATVAVKVTDCPDVDGLTEEVSVVVVGSATPMPNSVTDWVDPATLLALSVITMLADLLPEKTAANEVEMVQLAPGARVEPHVITGVEKSSASDPVGVTLAIFSVSVPGFERVTVCAGEVEPTRVLAKTSELVLRLLIGIP